MNKNIIEIKDLSMNFKDKQILDEISFNLESGNIYGFLGNNGVGKTTLIKIIFNELIPKTGSIKLNGIEQKDINYLEWYFFVENNELPLNITIDDYFKTVISLAKKDYQQAKKEFHKLKEELNVEFNANKKLKNYSAGERKIISMMIAIILNPKVIFFDEPTANLDIKNKQIILKLIELMKNDERIIVITTHLIEEVKSLLTNVIILDQKKITYNEKFNSNDDLKTIFNNHVAEKNVNFDYLKNSLKTN